MATIFKWAGDGLAPGNLTTTSAGTGDTAPAGQGNSGIGQTIVASGARSPRIQLAQQAGGGCNVYWNFASTNQIAGRFYIELTSALAANHEVARLASGSTRLWSLNLSSNNNRMNMYDSANTLVAQSPVNSIEVSTVYRIDFCVNADTDSVVVNVYDGENTTPLFTLAPVLTVDGGFTRFQIGHPLNTPTAEVQLWDDIELVDVLTPPGPVEEEPEEPAATLLKWQGDGLSPGAFTLASIGTGDTAPSGQGGAGAGQTIVASGTRSPRIRLAQQAGTGVNTWWDFSAVNQVAGRFYIEIASALAANHEFVRLASGGTRLWSMNFSSTNNRINMYDSNNTLIAQSSANSIETGVVYRIDFSIDATVDTVVVRVYAGEQTTPMFTMNPASPVITGGFTRFQIGHSLTTPTAEVQLWDDIEVVASLTPPGPLGVVEDVYESGMTVWDGAVERHVSAWLWDGSNEHLLGAVTTIANLPTGLGMSDAGMRVVLGGSEHLWLGSEWYQVAVPSWQSNFSPSMHPNHLDVKSYDTRSGYSAFGHTPDHGVITPDNLLYDNGRAIFRASWRDSPIITGAGASERIRWHDEAYADHRRTSTAGNPIYEQRWGVWQVTCQASNGDNTQGSLCAFWGRHRNPGGLPGGHGSAGEWDFMETWGRGGSTPTATGQVPGGAVFTIHSSTNVATENGIPYRKTLFRYQEEFGLYSPNTWTHLSRNDPTPGNRSWDGMHTYRVEYFPNYLAFSFDNHRKVIKPTDIDPHTPSGHMLGNTYAWLWNPAFFSGPIQMRVNHHVGLGTPQLGGNPDPGNRSITQDPMDFIVEDIKLWGYEA